MKHYKIILCESSLEDAQEVIPSDHPVIMVSSKLVTNESIEKLEEER